MTITVYRSTDTSAPVLSGTAGSVIALLDACLVNGYGSKASSGWAKSFSGTNKAAYRAPQGTRPYFRIDDAGTTSARIRGFSDMTDVDTGTNPFPTDVQISGGLYIYKSITADATARGWLLIADQKAFYLFAYPSYTTLGSSTNTDSQIFFGDLKTYKPGDTLQAAIIGPTGAAINTNFFGQHQSQSVATVQYLSGHYLAGSFLGTIASAGTGKTTWHLGHTRTASGGINLGNTGVPYPEPVSGGLLFTPVMVMEYASGGAPALRGQYPGFWEPQHINVGSHLDTFTGTGAFAGITFILLNAWNTATAGRIAIQTSGDWYA